MRPRTPAEKQFIWSQIYQQCLNHRYTKEAAREHADKVIQQLGPNTPQPQSAADWLARNRPRKAG